MSHILHNETSAFGAMPLNRRISSTRLRAETSCSFSICSTFRRTRHRSNLCKLGLRLDAGPVALCYIGSSPASIRGNDLGLDLGSTHWALITPHVWSFSTEVVMFGVASLMGGGEILGGVIVMIAVLMMDEGTTLNHLAAEAAGMRTQSIDRKEDVVGCYFPWHRFHFSPLPHKQGSLRPCLGAWTLGAAQGTR